MLREMNSDTAIQLATLSSHEMNDRFWPNPDDGVQDSGLPICKTH